MGLFLLDYSKGYNTGQGRRSMPFNSWQEAEARLGNPAPLTSEEIGDLFPWMNLVGETAMRRLVLQDLRALQNFEKSSGRLAKVLIGLTVVLVVLTIVIARYTVVLARKEPSISDVKQLEERTRQLEAERTKNANDDDVRRLKLENCVSEANADFQKNLENNGKKARNGSYNVPVPLLEQMQRQKQSKIEECRLLYSK
jgi:hypothetical protein